MNNSKYILFILLCCFSCLPSLWSQAIDLRLAGKKNCVANTFCATIQLKSTETPLKIGTADFMLSYDNSAIAYRYFLAYDFDKLSHSNSAWHYCAIDSRSQPGLFHLTTEMRKVNGENPTVNPSEWQSAGTVCFDILQPDRSPKLAFVEQRLQINQATPNDGTNAFSIKSLEGIDAPSTLACTDAPEVADNFIGETGSKFLYQKKRNTWHTVSLKKTYRNPVVVANLSSYNGGEAAHIRVKNVTVNSFDVSIEEWDYLDGGHTTEKIDYLVVEEGSYTMDDGTVLQAGTIKQDAKWKRHRFVEPFRSNPVVMTQIMSDNYEGSAITRMKGITTTRFEVVLQSEEKNKVNMNFPKKEEVGWIAMQAPDGQMMPSLYYESGILPQKVNHQWSAHQFQQAFQYSAVLIGQAQTTNGGDPASLRFKHLSAKGVEVFVEEEKSQDSEISHVPEQVGYFLFEAGFISGDSEDFQPCIGEEGKVLKEIWTNVRSNRLKTLYNDTRFPKAPTEQQLVDAVKGPTRFGDRYATRVRGYLKPSVSGDYYFNITGDDQTRFFLSENTNPEKAKLKAKINGWTGVSQHNRYATQTSKKIKLTAGRLYFFDIHHKEGGGGDHFQLFWKRGEDKDWSSIDKQYLYAYQECKAQPRSTQRTNFNVVQNDVNADLYWVIENEYESDYFEIQTAKSVQDFDSDNYEVIGQEMGSGTGIAIIPNVYHFEDNIQTESEHKYYRIMQMHFDGTVEYSTIRSVYLQKSGVNIHVYPNPFTERVTVVFPDKFQTPTTDKVVDIEISDGLGRIIRQQKGYLDQSRVYEFEFDESFEAGVYLLSVKSAGNRLMSKKILRVK